MLNSQPKPSKELSAPMAPPELIFLFEDPPVLAHENSKSYYALLHQIAARLNPKDPFEWLWIKDFADSAWEIVRYRRAKAQILDFACGQALTALAESLLGYEDLSGAQS